jgi:stress-induced morphogen
MFAASEITRIIEEKIPGSIAIILDDAGDGEHFAGEVMSPSFVGKGLVAQHQEVYRALGRLMGAEIHALQLKTYTPEAWAKAGKPAKEQA